MHKEILIMIQMHPNILISKFNKAKEPDLMENRQVSN